ncbi:MAG: hypothetical protein LBI53_04310 [Candidatus Peribacteria bacterium]|jgi:hypothetical protein|nr:hypothetical protein [Candidatus Peribacteria bacterium]
MNLLALVGLFHDANHPGKNIENAEENSYTVAVERLPKNTFKKLSISKSKFFELIIATKIQQHGTIEERLTKIIQDADL